MKKKPLNKVAKAWVEALRSGEIKQAHRALGSADGSRCCLGALCDLAKKAGIITKFKLGDTYLPDAVRRWAKLGTEEGLYQSAEANVRTTLWKDNDGWGTITAKSFAQIADIIESQPEGLFE